MVPHAAGAIDLTRLRPVVVRRRPHPGARPGTPNPRGEPHPKPVRDTPRTGPRHRRPSSCGTGPDHSTRRRARRRHRRSLRTEGEARTGVSGDVPDGGRRLGTVGAPGSWRSCRRHSSRFGRFLDLCVTGVRSDAIHVVSFEVKPPNHDAEKIYIALREGTTRAGRWFGGRTPVQVSSTLNRIVRAWADDVEGRDTSATKRESASPSRGPVAYNVDGCTASRTPELSAARQESELLCRSIQTKRVPASTRWRSAVV